MQFTSVFFQRNFGYFWKFILSPYDFKYICPISKQHINILISKPLCKTLHDAIFQGTPLSSKISRVGLRPFCGSHARTSHVQMYVRTHTCAHLHFKVVALCTRTCTFCKLTFFQQFFSNFLPFLERSKTEQDVLKRYQNVINQDRTF